MNPITEHVLAELDETRDRWWLNAFLYNLGLCVCCCLLFLWIIVTVDCWWQSSALARILLFFLWAVTSLGMFGAILVHSMTQTRSLAATARRLELSFPELENHLITLVQLSEQHPTTPFLEQAASEASDRITAVPLFDAPYRYSLWQRWQLGIPTNGDLWGIAATALLSLTLTIVSYLAVAGWSDSLARSLRPWQFDDSNSEPSFQRASRCHFPSLVASSSRPARPRRPSAVGHPRKRLRCPLESDISISTRTSGRSTTAWN